jgi:hypothetical protein
MVDMDADELTFSSSHLAEQIAVKSFEPVIAISLTTRSRPAIYPGSSASPRARLWGKP